MQWPYKSVNREKELSFNALKICLLWSLVYEVSISELGIQPQVVVYEV